MKLIVGLGNPGPHYAKTRHNVGWRVVEALAKKFHAKNWKQSKRLLSRYTELSNPLPSPQTGSPDLSLGYQKGGEGGGEGEIRSVPVILALPDSFMNESGKPVRQLLKHFGIDFKSDLLIVLDDAALPFGKLRLRASGQDGGHRGLRSIEQALGGRDYARLRIGIAPSQPVEEPLEKYVLAPFSPVEEKSLPEILNRAVESCLLWLTHPIQKAMDWANKPSLTEQD